MKQDSAPEKPGAGESLYRKEPKIYARQVKGTFARLRVIAVWVLLGLTMYCRGLISMAIKPFCSICQRANSISWG